MALLLMIVVFSGCNKGYYKSHNITYTVIELTDNVLKLHSETDTPADMEFVRYTGTIPE